MKYDFSTRTAMSYRGALRLVPKKLRRQWLAMRLAYSAPRVNIGSAWVPPGVARNCLRIQ